MPTTIYENNSTLVRTATFDSSLWNSSTFFSDIATIYSGIQREELTQPLWTGSNFVAEPFSLPSTNRIPTNTTYLASTNAIFPQLNCEEARLIGEPDYGINLTRTLRANATFQSSGCEAEVPLYLADSTQAFDRQYVWAAENYVGGVQKVKCGEQSRFLVTVTQANEDLQITKSRCVHSI